MRLDDAELGPYLEEVGLKHTDERAEVIGAGDGNINFVRRVRLGGNRSLVVKQARAALERFPEYQVTTERICFEHRYGEVVRERSPRVAGLLPEVLHFDREKRVLILEDVGAGPRLDAELARGAVPHDALRTLGHYLATVHRATRPAASQLTAEFANDEMRALHGEHIFTLPYEPNDFPISAELHARAQKELARAGVRGRIRELRTRYYEERLALVHGDVQAGNLVLQGGRPRLLDAEIAHVGDPMFDLGSALGHLEVHRPAAVHPAAIEAGVRALLDGYQGACPELFQADRARQFAGAEVARRAIGAARLTCLQRDDDAARALSHAVDLLLS